MEARVVHVPDVLADPEYTWSGAQKIGGYRAALGAPLLRKGNVVGVIFVAKTVPQPFTAKQIELVTTFADQAVIAIENTRLLNELRQRTGDLSELLEQQTATSEVLQVISSSTGELEPVFQAILASATRICDAKFGLLYRIENGSARIISKLGIPPAFAEYLKRGPAPATVESGEPASSNRPCHPTRQLVHLADYRTDQSYLTATQSQLRPLNSAASGPYSLVPMLKDDELIGAIVIYRQEVRPFTDKQIELVQNFAARPSSPSRTRACSTSCANRCSSRPPPPTCSRSSAARPSICRRCSTRWSSPRRSCARRTSHADPAWRERRTGIRLASRASRPEQRTTGGASVSNPDADQWRAERCSKAGRSYCRPATEADPEFTS